MLREVQQTQELLLLSDSESGGPAAATDMPEVTGLRSFVFLCCRYLSMQSSHQIS